METPSLKCYLISEDAAAAGRSCFFPGLGVGVAAQPPGLPMVRALWGLPSQPSFVPWSPLCGTPDGHRKESAPPRHHRQPEVGHPAFSSPLLQSEHRLFPSDPGSLCLPFPLVACDH